MSDTLTVTGLATNTGTMTVNAVITGDVSSSNILDVNAGGGIDGALTVTAGTTTLAGNLGLLQAQGGTVTVDGDMSVSGTVQNDTTMTVNTGTTMTVAGLTTNSGTGALTVDGTLAGDVQNDLGGTLDVNGTVDGDVDNDGTMTLAGVVTEDLTNNAGLTVDGVSTVNGAFDNTGTTDVNAGLTVDGLTDNDGTLNINLGGSLTGDVENEGIVNLASLMTGDLTTQNGGLSTVTGTLDGNLTTDTGGTSDLTGTVTGNATNDGTFNMDGTVDGDLTNTGGTTNLNGGVGGALDNSATLTLAGNSTVGSTFTNSGTATVGAGLELDVTGGTTNAAGGNLTVTGTLDSDVQNDGTAMLTVDGTVDGAVTNANGGTADVNGTVTGNVDNDGTMTLAGMLGGDLDNSLDVTVDGASTVAGGVTNSGDLTVNSTLDVAGLLDNGGTVDANAGLTWGSFTNTGTLNVNGAIGSAGSGLLTSTGTINLTSGASITSDVTIDGTTLAVDGAVALNGELSAVGATIDLVDASPVTPASALGDVLTVNGGADLTDATIRLDVDLSGTEAAHDAVNITGLVVPTATDASNPSTTPNAVTLDFTNVALGDERGDLTTDLTVLTYGGALPGFNAQGLGSSGALIYFLDTATAGEVTLKSSANPALGALSGSVGLTQSLIGAVINRPSSPFVAGLAVPGDDPCGFGTWGRFVGGSADATGSSSTQSSGGSAGLAVESELTADYAGFQLGLDHSCFAGHYNGWDLSFGGIVGLNEGKTSQPVFPIDPSTGLASTITPASYNNMDFRQTYGGVYVTAVKDRFLMDLQYRYEWTDFDLENTGADGSDDRVGIMDQSFDSTAHTLSGSVSYVIPVNEETRVNFIPTAGFSYTSTTTDNIMLSSTHAVDGPADGVLVIEDSTTEVGFLGGTLSRTNVAPSGTWAMTYFGTATVYHDFSGASRSTYYGTLADFDAGTNGQVIESSNLGTYGEVSLGVNYTKLLDGQGMLGGRQFNASARIDGRAGDAQTSWGLTAQVRLQF